MKQLGKMFLLKTQPINFIKLAVTGKQYHIPISITGESSDNPIQSRVEIVYVRVNVIYGRRRFLPRLRASAVMYLGV